MIVSMDNNIRLYIPANNISERIYVIDVLFKELLNVNYEVVTDKDQVESLVIQTCDKVFVFEDHFWNNYLEPNSYLSKENIPQGITKLSSFTALDIPIIYGKDKYLVEEERTLCGLDILASTFFMLSRWEEYVLGRKDTGKCNEEELLCVKAGYARVPIVHVYEEFLKSLLNEAGIEVNFCRKFTIKTTHDVDRCYLTGWGELFGNAKYIYVNGNKQLAWKIVKDYIWLKTHFKNPFDTYEFFMDCAEQLGIKDEFYFKCCEANETGKTYQIGDKEVQRFIKCIKNRKHIIGFHPSENTYANPSQFAKEVERFINGTQSTSLTGRNHMLLITAATFRDWEKAQAEYVSNYGYQSRNGFRCGIAVPFSVFDFEKRKKMNIKEIPFEIMDTVMLRCKPNLKESIDDIKGIVEIVSNHCGILCTNWHSNVYNMRAMVSYKQVYLSMIDYIRKELTTISI